MGGVKTISIIVAANIKGLEAGLGKANKSLSAFASKAARLGSMMSFGVTAPLAAVGKQAFDTFSTFENSMMKVNTVTGATIEEFKILTAEAKRLGSTTQFTASQVADLQLVLGRKGFDPTQIKNMEKSILDLALATGEDLSLAAETVSTSINAFNLESREASRVANTLASAAANSSVQLSTFSTAFGHAGASAKAVGIDLEELSAMMGVLMDNGIKASKAGTGLRRVFTDLNREGVDLSEVLDIITDGEMGLNRAKQMVGRTAANQLLILAKNKEKVKELTKEYKTNTGRLNEMAEAMGKTTHARIKKMQSAIEGLQLELGALIADAITPVIDNVTELAGRFGELDEGVQKAIITFAAIMGAVGPVLIGLAALLSLVNPLALGFVAVAAGIAAVTSASNSSKSSLEQEASDLDALTQSAMSAAEGSTVRLKIIKEIQEKYPDYLGNLKAEEVSNNDLATAARNYNLELQKRIILKRGEEKLTEGINKVADAIESQKEELIDFNKAASDYNDEFLGGLIELKGMNPEEQFKAITSEVKQLGIELGTSKKGGTELAGKMLKGLTSAILAYRGSTNVVENAKAALDGINQDMADLAKELGMTLEELHGALGVIGKSTDDPDTPDGPEGGDAPEMSGFDKFFTKAGEKIAKFYEKWGASIKMVGDIFNQMIENKMMRLDNYHKKESAAIEGSTMSEEAKAKAQEALDKDVEKKKAKLQRKAAIAEKAANIASAIMNTAVAVSKVIGQLGIFGIPMAQIVAGLGAVQVATIASQPIPQFADGGIVSGETLGVMGEYAGARSNPEVIAPLDKLQSMLGGGTQTIIPDVRITGDDLLIVFDKAQRRKVRR